MQLAAFLQKECYNAKQRSNSQISSQGQNTYWSIKVTVKSGAQGQNTFCP